MVPAKAEKGEIQLDGTINFRYPVNFNSIPVVVRRRKKNDELGGHMNWHKEIEIIYLKSGRCQTFINGNTYEITGGDIALANSNEVHHRLWFYGECDFIVLQLDPHFFVYSDSDFVENSLVGKVDSYNAVFDTIIRDEKLGNQIDKIADLRAACDTDVSVALLTIAETYRFYSMLIEKYCKETEKEVYMTDSQRKYVIHVLNYVNDNFSGEIYIPDIAAQLHISATYLSHVFSESTGMTISEYINQIRCRNAVMFMKKGMTVTEAAFSAGYNDTAYFSRVFKKIMGTSPSESGEKT